MPRRTLIVLIVIFLLTAAAIIFLNRPAPSGLHLAAVSFSDLPGWKESEAKAALRAFRQSCAVLAQKPASLVMGGAGYAGTVGDWVKACNGLSAAKTARAFFEANFKPFALSFSGEKYGLFTGYYEPELRASKTRHGIYNTPVYGVPDDLITADLGAFRPSLKGETIAGRIENKRLVPYATRAEIDARPLTNAPVLFYAADPIEVFFLHIQGSGRIVFDDGSRARAVYAGKNGRLYTAIGRTLVERGALTKENVSMQTIRAWLKAHTKEAASIMHTNESYTFFSLLPLGDPTLGSKGSEGVPLTAEASLAVDNRIHPLGVPFFLAAEVDGEAFRKILIAQDTGGAIRGPLRGDVYWGAGARAEKLAGEMKSKGALFVLLPNDAAKRLGSGKTFKTP